MEYAQKTQKGEKVKISSNPEYLNPISGEVSVDSETVPYISLGSKIGNFGKQDFSVAFWFKTTDNWRLFDILGNRQQGSHGNFFCIRMPGNHETHTPGIIYVEIDQDYNGTNYNVIMSERAGLNDGEWHHITVIRERKLLKMYVDGELAGENESEDVTDIKNCHEFRLGKSYCDFERASISFKDFRVYGKAISDEILSELSAKSQKEEKED